MLTRKKRVLFVLPFTVLPGLVVAASTASCEIAVNLDPMVIDAGAYSDVLDCGICADVSADANYDAADVTIYGIPPSDAGVDRGVHDAGVDRTVHDAAAE